MKRWNWRNKLTKKAVSVIMAAVMTVAIIGCGSSGDNVGNDTTATSSEQSQVSGTNVETTEETDYSDITLVYASAGAWNMLMPYNDSNSYCGIVWDQIYDRLFYVSGSCKLLSRSCESYEVENNVWTFHLNQNAKWHDGEPVTANDWAYTLKLISKADTAVSVRSIAPYVEGTNEVGIETSEDSIAIEVVDDYTFKLTMKEEVPFESFWLTYNKGFYVLPEHLLKDIAPVDMMADKFWFSPIGSGPCKYESEISGSEITLATNQDYYLGAPKFGHLVIRVMDQSNFINSLLANEIDLEWIFLGIEDALAVKEQPNIQIVENKIADFLEIMVYNNKSLSENRWRQAFTMAIDRNALNNGYYAGTGQLWDIWIHPDNVAVPADANYVYDYDPEKAKALLEESGFDFNYEVKIVCNTASREKQCALVQQNLQAIGVKSSVQYLDSTTMWNGMFAGEYDICMMGLMPTTDAWSLESTFNPEAMTYGSYTDTKLMDMFAAAKVEKDETKQTELLVDVMDYMYEQAYNCNVIWKKSYAGLSSRLTNVDVFAANYYNNDTWNWVVTE